MLRFSGPVPFNRTPGQNASDGEKRKRKYRWVEEGKDDGADGGLGSIQVSGEEIKAVCEEFWKQPRLNNRSEDDYTQVNTEALQQQFIN